MTIDIDQQTLHIQWYNHGSSTVMGELAHPQELFLQALCGPVLFDSVAAKITVHYHKPQRTINQKATSSKTDNIPLGEYFCKCVHCHIFLSISFTYTLVGLCPDPSMNHLPLISPPSGMNSTLLAVPLRKSRKIVPFVIWSQNTNRKRSQRPSRIMPGSLYEVMNIIYRTSCSTGLSQ